jgi:hypothetical protein
MPDLLYINLRVYLGDGRIKLTYGKCLIIIIIIITIIIVPNLVV